MKIKNADIIVSGVGLSDVYFDEDYIVEKNHDFTSIKELIQKSLCDQCEEELWTSNLELDINDSLLKSYSSYKRLTKRDYIVACQLQPVVYTTELKERDTLGVLETLENKMFKLFDLNELVIRDIVLRFYSYGNVTIHGRFQIRNQKLSIEEYNQISNFVHAFFGIALRTTISKAIGRYIDLIRKLDDVKHCLLKLPIQSDLLEGNSLEKITSNTLQFAIRTHFIYDTEQKNKSSIAPFKSTLLGEWEKALEDVMVLEECVAYLGWSHSLYLFNDWNALKNVDKYTVPMEVVMSNWAALQGLRIRIEKAHHVFTERMNNNKVKKVKYDKIADDVKEFILKFERMIAYFDSYTVSNNPMYFHLIDLQKEAFFEKNHISRVKSRLILLKEVVEELAARQRKLYDKKINRILFVITIFALLNSVQVTYELLVNKNKDDLYYILGIFLGLICAIFLYLRINKSDTK